MTRPMRNRWPFALLVVLTSVIGFVGLRMGLDPLLGKNAPLILFMLPVVVSAWAGGFWPGLLATVLGLAFGLTMFVDRPADQSVLSHWLGRGAPFLFVGACLSFFAHVMNRARLEAKEATNALMEARRRSDASLLVGEVGTYYWDIKADRVYGDRNFFPMFGLTVGENGWAPVQHFVDAVHPDDRDRASREIAATLNQGAPYNTEYRVAVGGGVRWLISRGTIERDAEGQPVGWPGVVVDVTAVKLAEQQLAESENQFRTLFTSMDAGYCIIEMIDDAAGRCVNYRYLLTNPAFEKQTGLKDVVGKTVRDIFPDHDAVWYDTYGRVAATGEPVRFVQNNASSAGDTWFDLYAFRVGGPGSRRVAVLFTNITDRKRHEADLTATARQRDALLDLQRAVGRATDRGEAAVIDEAANRVLAVVPAAQGSAIEMLEARPPGEEEVLVYRAAAGAMAGFIGLRVKRAASLSGRCLTEALPLVCDDTETDDRVDRAACRKIGIRSMLVVPILRSGAAVGVLKFASDRTRAFGEADLLAAQLTVGAIATGLSGAAEARAIEALRRSEAQFRLIADAMPQFVWVCRPDGSREFTNRRWYEYAGDHAAGVDGQNWYEPLHADDRGRAVARWQQSLDTGEPFETEYRFKRHDGIYRWFLGRALAVRNDAGDIVNWYGTCTDIEEQKRLQQQYDVLLESERTARTNAEQAGRMKDDFLATISHELRTPLSAIVGWSHLLTPETEHATLAEGLAVIHRNAATQSQLIEDILDVSRITSGRMRLKTRRVTLAEPMNAAIATVRTAADAKGVALRLHCDPGVEIVADPERLQQIFWNLLANAIKFTDRGGQVTVHCRHAEGQASIDVIDTGRGIEADFLPYVFDRFRQADMTTTRRHGGLGLGLAIVRHLVELHGGRVSATSDGDGHGSTFRVELPLGVAGPHAEPSPAALDRPVDNLAGRRVLVIDDEPDARRVIEAMLGRHRIETVLSDNVADAVGMLSGGNHFDAVVSDIGMPGEDGYAFIRRLRAMEADRRGPRLPAVALTAYTRTTDRASVLDAGFDRYLAKPVNPTELLAMLDDVIVAPNDN